MTKASSGLWGAGADSSWYSMYQPLARLLYGIGFVGCSVRQNAAPSFYFDDPLLLDSESNFERIQWWLPHRAYHTALDIRAGYEQPEAVTS